MSLALSSAIIRLVNDLLSTHRPYIAAAGEIEVVIGVGVAITTEKIDKPSENYFVRV